MAKIQPDDWELQLAIMLEPTELLVDILPDHDIIAASRIQLQGTPSSSPSGSPSKTRTTVLSHSSSNPSLASPEHSSKQKHNGYKVGGTCQSTGERVQILSYDLDAEGAKKCMREGVLLKRRSLLHGKALTPSLQLGLSNTVLPIGIWMSKFSTKLYLVTKETGPFSLAKLLDTNDLLSADIISQTLKCVLSSLDAVHQLGIAHCAVSPENIFLHTCADNSSSDSSDEGSNFAISNYSQCCKDCDYANSACQSAPSPPIRALLTGFSECVEFVPTLSDISHLATGSLVSSNRNIPACWNSPELCSLILKPKLKRRKARLRNCIFKSDIWSIGILALTLIEHNLALIHPQRTKSESVYQSTRTGSFSPRDIRPKSTLSSALLAQLSLKQVSQLSSNPKILQSRKWTPIAQDFVQSCLKIDPDERPSASTLLKHPFLTSVASTGIMSQADVSESEASNLEDTYEDSTTLTYIPAPDSDSLGGSEEDDFYDSEEDTWQSRTIENSIGSSNQPSKHLRTLDGSGSLHDEPSTSPTSLRTAMSLRTTNYEEDDDDHLAASYDSTCSDRTTVINDDLTDSVVYIEPAYKSPKVSMNRSPSRPGISSNRLQYGGTLTSDGYESSYYSEGARIDPLQKTARIVKNSKGKMSISDLPDRQDLLKARLQIFEPSKIIRSKSKRRMASENNSPTYPNILSGEEDPSFVQKPLRSSDSGERSNRKINRRSSPSALNVGPIMRPVSPNRLEKPSQPGPPSIPPLLNSRRSSMPQLPLYVMPSPVSAEVSPKSPIAPKPSKAFSSPSASFSPPISHMPSTKAASMIEPSKLSISGRSLKSKSEERLDTSTLDNTNSPSNSSPTPPTPSRKVKKKKKIFQAWDILTHSKHLVTDESYDKEVEECEAKWNAEIKKRHRILENKEKEAMEKCQTRLRVIRKKYDSHISSIRRRDETKLAELRHRAQEEKSKLLSEQQKELEKELNLETYSFTGGSPIFTQSLHGKRPQFPKRVLHASHAKQMYELERSHIQERQEMEIKSIDDISVVEREFELSKYLLDMYQLELKLDLQRAQQEEIHEIKLKMNEEIKLMTRKYVARRVKKLAEGSTSTYESQSLIGERLLSSIMNTYTSPRPDPLEPVGSSLLNFEISPDSIAVPSHLTGTLYDRFQKNLELQKWKQDEELESLRRDVQCAEEYRSESLELNSRQAQEILDMQNAFEVHFQRTRQVFLGDKLLKTHQHELELVDLKYMYQRRLLAKLDGEALANAEASLNEQTEAEHKSLAQIFAMKRQELSQTASTLTPSKAQLREQLASVKELGTSNHESSSDTL